LSDSGATAVVRPELEGGVEIVRRTLLQLDLPVRDVQQYSELIRREGLSESDRPSAEQVRVLHDLVTAAQGLEVTWLTVEAGSPLAGQTIAASHLRTRTGASIVAISRASGLIPNPGPSELVNSGDRLAVIGTSRQVDEVNRSVQAL
jgi:CPA2 family monovalent cation:H+ antiporter-2